MHILHNVSIKKADVICRTVLQKMKVAIHSTVLQTAETDRKIQDGPESNEKTAIRRTVTLLTLLNPTCYRNDI